MASRIVIELNTSNQSRINYQCKQNDDLILEGDVYEGGVNKDLANVTIIVQAKKADDTFIIQSNNIVIIDNKIVANLNRDFTRIAGKTEIEVVLTEGSRQNTTFSFFLEVIASAIKKPVERNNTVTILEELQNKVVRAGEIRDETEHFIKNGGAATTGDIAKVNSQLEQKAQKTETQNIQQQVNNLVLGAVGDGNNAEIEQARGSYSVLNARLEDMVKVKVIKEPKNIFNTKDAIIGKSLSYFNADRTPFLTDNAGKTVYYIPVNSNSDYTISWSLLGDGALMVIAEVDSEKKQSVATSINYPKEKLSITTSGTTKYLLINIATVRKDDIQVEKGLVKTNYETWFETVKTVEIFNNLDTEKTNYVLAEIENAKGDSETLKDKIDSTARKNIYKQSRNLFNPIDVVVGKMLSYFGGDRLPVFSSNEAYYTIYIPCNGLSEYTVSWRLLGDNNSIIIAEVDTEKKQVSSSSIMYPTEMKSFTTKATTKYLMISIPYNRFGDIQINKGLVRSEYEPYFETEYSAEILGGLNTKESLNCFEEVNKLKQIMREVTKIATWGDSLTWGAGSNEKIDGNKYNYPKVLQNILGDKYKVVNCGIGGENASMIGARQGGYPYIVSPFTIPATKEDKVEITIKTLNGTSAYPLKQTEWGTGVNDGVSLTINPCTINGIDGVISTNEGVTKYYFNRIEDGETTTIKRPSPIITNAHKNLKDTIQIIWIGANGGFNSEEELIRIIKSMVENTDLVKPKYIVLGLTKRVETTLDALMEKEFGRHFINVRDYITTPIYHTNGTTIISSYGLDDVNITPTTNDIGDITLRKIPPSLLSDDTHFNINGYNVIANLVHKKGIELLYW